MKELNVLEMELLQKIDFELSVERSLFDEYVVGLMSVP